MKLNRIHKAIIGVGAAGLMGIAGAQLRGNKHENANVYSPDESETPAIIAKKTETTATQTIREKVLGNLGVKFEGTTFDKDTKMLSETRCAELPYKENADAMAAETAAKAASLAGIRSSVQGLTGNEHTLNTLLENSGSALKTTTSIATFKKSANGNGMIIDNSNGKFTVSNDEKVIACARTDIMSNQEVKDLKVAYGVPKE